VAPSQPCVPHPPADSDDPGVIPIHIDITDPSSVEAAAAIANDVTLLIDTGRDGQPRNTSRRFD
jgi:hypothetical protein